MHSANLIVRLLGLFTVLVTTVRAQDVFTSHGPFDGATEQVLVANDGTVYSVTRARRAFRSTDDGLTWTMCGPNRMPGSTITHHIRMLAVDSTGRLFAGSEFGMWRSTNRGTSWERASNGFPAQADVYNIQTSRRGTLFIDMGIVGMPGVPFFYRSTDNGESWHASYLDSVAQPDLWSVSGHPDGTVFASSPGSVWKSTDEGNSWTRTSLQLDTSLIPQVYADNSGHVWAWVSQSNTLYLSTDSGSTWTDRNQVGLPPNTFNSSFTRSTRGVYLAGTVSGIYRSIDSGRIWTPAHPTEPNLEVGARVACSPAGSTFCNHGLLYRSIDDGSSWTEANDQSSPIEVNALTRLNDGTVLAGASFGFHRSGDNGWTWSRSDQGMPVASLVKGFLQLADGSILASTWHHGIYRSTDTGRSWTVSNFGMPTVGILGPGLTHALEGVVLLATEGGVFRSTDGGEHWTTSSTGLPVASVYGVTLLENDMLLAGTKGGGIFRSTNNGFTWGEANNGVTTPDVVSFFLAANGTLFAGTKDGGLYESRNLGDDWQQILPATQHTLCKWAWRWSQNAAGTIYLGTQALLRSTDNGNSWSAALTVGLTTGVYFTDALLVRDFSIDSAGRLSVGCRYPVGVTTLQTDSGSAWRRAVGVIGPVRAATETFWALNEWIATTVGLYAVTNDATDAAQPVRLHWSAIDESDVQSLATVSDYVIAAMSDGVRRYDQVAKRWNEPDSGLPATQVQALAVRFMGRAIYAGTARGVYRSDDTALTWTPSREGLGEVAVTQLVISGSGALLASAPGHGLYRSDDEGAQWSQSQEGLPSNTVLSLAVIGGRTLYAGTDGAGVYRSDDDGRTWTSVGPELSTAVVHAIAVNSDGLVFAGTEEGTYRSTNRGSSWERVNPEQQGRVNMITVSNNGRIYVGTDDGLYYSTTASPVSGVDNGSHGVAGVSEQVLSIVPNPAGGMCEIHYVVPHAGRVHAALYDLFGREVKTLSTVHGEVGEQRIAFDTGDLAEGLYYVRLLCNGESVIKGLLVAR